MNVVAFNCDQCGTCCRSHRVPITKADVNRLAKLPQFLGDSRQKLGNALELLSPEQVDIVGEPESLAQLKEGPRLVVLRHNKTSTNEALGCVFLRREGGCSIHPDRPMACRAYPFDRPEPDESDDLGLHPDRLCPAEALVLSKRPDTSQRFEESGAFEVWVKKRDEEASQHALWIQKWNRKQRLRLRLGRAFGSGQQLLHSLVAAADTAHPL